VSDDRGELALSAFERGVLFMMVVMSLLFAYDLGILPF